MGEKPLENMSGNGLELDRLELPSRSSPETVDKSTAGSEQKTALSSGTDWFRKRHLWLALTAVTVTLALLTIMAIYMKKQNLEVSFLTLKNTSFSNSYLHVGPVTATIRNDEIIRLSLNIACKNDAVKERLAEKDSRIRDKIVSVISAPETKTLLENHQYEVIRGKLKQSLDTIYGNAIGEIYFDELITY